MVGSGSWISVAISEQLREAYTPWISNAISDQLRRAQDAEAATPAIEDAKAAAESLLEETAAAGAKKAELEALLAPHGQLAQWQTVAAEQKEANAYVRSLRPKSKFEQTLLHVLASPLMP